MKKLHILFITFICAFTSQAADRALIIGITDYQQIKYQLPGIGLDVEMAQKMAKMLNFKADEIKTLSGQQATATNIKNAISTWLVQGVSSQDRIFLYYSGHGGQFKDKNGDEKDGNDEYITAYDLGNSINQSGYILDDEMAVLLNKIPSHYKMLMLDSCHSGTTTRSIVPNSQVLGGKRLHSKLHYFGKAPVRSTSTNHNTKNTFIEGAPYTLAFAAAQDDESARADVNGSLFTIGMYQALQKSTQIGGSIKPSILIEQAAEFIENALSAKGDEDAIHHPLIFGDKKLLQKPLKLASSRNGQGVNWHDLQQLAQSGQPLKARVNETSFVKGDKIEFSLEVPTDGYLNIINVDAHDEAAIIYPNQHNPNNAINAGKQKIPGYLLNFDIIATEPYGQSLTVFVFTTKPLNLYKQALNVRNSEGKYIKYFAQLNQYSMRSMKERVKEQSESDQLYTTGLISTVKK